MFVKNAFEDEGLAKSIYVLLKMHLKMKLAKSICMCGWQSLCVCVWSTVCFHWLIYFLVYVCVWSVCFYCVFWLENDFCTVYLHNLRHISEIYANGSSCVSGLDNKHISVWFMCVRNVCFHCVKCLT
jgi:hypothetical protein